MMADTIVAIATPPGQGGVAVLRISGEKALRIAEQVTHKQPKPRMATLSHFYDSEGAVIDQGLLLYFPSPHSFTGEEVIELQGHGGQAVSQLVLQSCLSAGARLAEAGEFTKRAFLNDKLDLAQAEAVADLIHARSRAAVLAASRSLQGEFSRAVKALDDELLSLRVYIEAALDFPEEEIDFLTEGDIAGRLAHWGQSLRELLDKTHQGKLLNDGVNIVLVGEPNVGKSSLLNALVGDDCAIVTAQAGTTRDIIRERLVIEGVPVNILDTAGIRDSEDIVEQEGIRRSKMAIEQADLVLWLSDLSQHDESVVDSALLPLLAGKPLLRVYNKSDLLENPDDLSVQDAILISAKTGDGLPELVHHIAQSIGRREAEEDTFIARERHIQALKACWQYYQNALAQLHGARMGELVAEDLRLAHEKLGEITGVISADELLGAIFSSFCIGK